MEVIAKHYIANKGRRPFDISGYAECESDSQYELSLGDLIKLRHSDMDLVWRKACHYIYSARDIERKLEAVEWIIPPGQDDIFLSSSLDDRILMRIVERGINFKFPSQCSYDLESVIKFVSKHQLFNLPIVISDYDNLNLIEYCQLIDYPIKHIPRREPTYSEGSLASAIHNNKKEVILEAIESGSFGNYFWANNLSTRAIYNLFLYPQSNLLSHDLFTVLLDRDINGEYFKDKRFDDYWKGLNQKYVTNRKALEYMREIGLEVKDSNRIISDNIEALKNPNIDRSPIIEYAYYKLDLIESFDHVDMMIKLTENIEHAWAILIRLMRKRIINLSSYYGRNPLLDHLLQIQPPTKVKSARSHLSIERSECENARSV